MLARSPRTLAIVSLVVSAFAACSHTATGATPEGAETQDSRRRAPATCALPGTERAHPVAPLTLPSDCRVLSAGPSSTPRVVRTADELAGVIQCESSAAPSIDLATHDLYAVRFTMSPAFGGIEAMDDGTTLTIGTRFRPNCPGDPMPMPMDGTLTFLLPKGPERAYREASCTLPSRCD